MASNDKKDVVEDPVQKDESLKGQDTKSAESTDNAPAATTSKNDKSVAGKKSGKRAEKVGIVWSDKMMKTVVVRVDRKFKHRLYQKYINQRHKFMAHDELGASTGDRVRIVETRPLSAKKRWRVVEIIQKAEK